MLNKNKNGSKGLPPQKMGEYIIYIYVYYWIVGEQIIFYEAPKDHPQGFTLRDGKRLLFTLLVAIWYISIKISSKPKPT